MISTKLLAGRTVVRVLADERPDDSFAPVEPSLEDVYFAAMRPGPRAELLKADETVAV